MDVGGGGGACVQFDLLLNGAFLDHLVKKLLHGGIEAGFWEVGVTGAPGREAGGGFFQAFIALDVSLRMVLAPGAVGVDG